MNANPDPLELDRRGEAGSTPNGKNPKLQPKARPWRLRSCLLGVGVVLLMLFASAYCYQQWFGIKADPNLKNAKIVSVGNDKNSDNQEDETPAGITAGLTEKAINDAEHPLIPTLEIARLGLANIENNVFDYEAVVIKQALVKNKLTKLEHMKVKLRHKRKLEDGTEIPFSVYTKFLGPDAVVGQEAIFVEGWNEGKLIAHAKPGSFLNLSRVSLDPNGFLAMRGTIYPITMLGIKNLVKQMIEKGTRDLEHDECQVTFDRNIEIDGRKCTLIEITHPEERDYFEFHKAKIYIDQEYQIPVAYEGFLWPKEEGGEPRLLEKYFYTELKINIGLDDSDFDPDNEEYAYPG